jgi:hypothetical protein
MDQVLSDAAHSARLDSSELLDKWPREGQFYWRLCRRHCSVSCRRRQYPSDSWWRTDCDAALGGFALWRRRRSAIPVWSHDSSAHVALAPRFLPRPAPPALWIPSPAIRTPLRNRAPAWSWRVRNRCGRHHFRKVEVAPHVHESVTEWPSGTCEEGTSSARGREGILGRTP